MFTKNLVLKVTTQHFEQEFSLENIKHFVIFENVQAKMLNLTFLQQFVAKL